MSILHLHIVRKQQPREFESVDADVAARLTRADCEAISGGYPDKSIRAEEEWMKTTGRLLMAFGWGLFMWLLLIIFLPRA